MKPSTNTLKKKHWYFKHITLCPVCQDEKIDLERRYTPKPKNYQDRQETTEYYNYCNE